MKIVGYVVDEWREQDGSMSNTYETEEKARQRLFEAISEAPDCPVSEIVANCKNGGVYDVEFNSEDPEKVTQAWVEINGSNYRSVSWKIYALVKNNSGRIIIAEV